MLDPDGEVRLRGRTLNVDRDGLPTLGEVALPARRNGQVAGVFLIVAATQIVLQPTLEQRRVAVALANQVGAAHAHRSG